MNGLQIFQNEAFKVRTTVKDNEPWFVAADVLRVLDVDRTSLERLDDDEKGVDSIHTPGGRQSVTIVSEPGLYALVLGSRKKEAKAFKRWVTHEVIPSIRRYGVYAARRSSIALACSFVNLTVITSGSIAKVSETCGSIGTITIDSKCNHTLL